MAKKKDEKDVLVVRDEKTGEISVVAGLNADGTPKRTPAKAENAQSFLQFDRHGDVLDNFFKNFFRQCKEPSRFGFYRIAADQVDSMLGVMKDLLQHPYQNKQILAPHKIDTFPYQQQVMEEQAAQQTEKQEPQKQENMELMGVYDESLVEPLARVMANLGVVRGMVVYGQDKLDEISMCAPTTVCEIKDGTFTSYEITPEQFGYERCEKGVLTGGTPQENAQITLDIISGKELGAKRNAVCLNAGAAIYLAGKADSIEAGVRKAEQIIDEGLALKKLEQFKEESNK